METRQVTQLKIFKLFLNEARYNFPDLVAIGFDETSLDNYIADLKVDEYYEDIDIDEEDGINITTTKVKKCFKEKSNLEYYNLDKPIDSYKYGVSTQWINEDDFEKFKQEYPLVPILIETAI